MAILYVLAVGNNIDLCRPQRSHTCKDRMPMLTMSTLWPTVLPTAILWPIALPLWHIVLLHVNVMAYSTTIVAHSTTLCYYCGLSCHYCGLYIVLLHATTVAYSSYCCMSTL